MTDNTFPIGRYSRGDVEAALDNVIDQRLQNRNTAIPATFTKDYYGWNFHSGVVANSNGVFDKWIPFEHPIPNIVNVQTQFLGLGAMSNPSGIYGSTFPYFTGLPAMPITVAGIQDSGFSARFCTVKDTTGNGVTFLSSAYLFNWHVVARVK